LSFLNSFKQLSCCTQSSLISPGFGPKNTADGPGYMLKPQSVSNRPPTTPNAHLHLVDRWTSRLLAKPAIYKQSERLRIRSDTLTSPHCRVGRSVKPNKLGGHSSCPLQEIPLGFSLIEQRRRPFFGSWLNTLCKSPTAQGKFIDSTSMSGGILLFSTFFQFCTTVPV